MSDQLDNHDEERLGEILRSAVPDGPEPIGRADAVIRRGRTARRVRAGAGVLAVGAVAAALVITPRLVGSEAANPTSNATTNRHEHLSHPYACHPGTDFSVPDSDELPTGAVLARVCPARTGSFAPPTDALVTDVDALVDLVNGLPGLPRDVACTDEASRYVYTITFQYPNGRLIRVFGADQGCGIVRIGRADAPVRSGADQLLTAYLVGLREQRDSDQPPTLPAEMTPRCTAKAFGIQPGLLPLNAQLELARAVVCEYSDRSDALLRSGKLSSAQIGTAVRDYLGDRGRPNPPSPRCNGSRPKMIEIIGISTWGDSVLFYESGSCGYLSRLSAFHDEQINWSPSPQVREIISSALGR